MERLGARVNDFAESPNLKFLERVGWKETLGLRIKVFEVLADGHGFGKIHVVDFEDGDKEAGVHGLVVFGLLLFFYEVDVFVVVFNPLNIKYDSQPPAAS